MAWAFDSTDSITAVIPWIGSASFLLLPPLPQCSHPPLSQKNNAISSLFLGHRTCLSHHLHNQNNEISEEILFLAQFPATCWIFTKLFVRIFFFLVVQTLFQDKSWVPGLWIHQCWSQLRSLPTHSLFRHMLICKGPDLARSS